jgi:hypothetical protein
VFRKKDDFPTP